MRKIKCLWLCAAAMLSVMVACSKSDKEEPAPVHVITTFEEFNGTTQVNPTLVLQSDIQGAAYITRADGIVDFNGHSVDYLYLQNDVLNKSITLKKGVVKLRVDGEDAWFDVFKGTVILEDMTFENEFYTDGHHIEIKSGTYHRICTFKKDDAPGDVVIYGGKFGPHFDDNPDVLDRKGSFLIYGGKYAFNPAVYEGSNITIADGYSVQSNTDSDSVTYPYVVYVGSDNTPKAIDLGLSVKWGDRNLCADSPEAVGAFYSWGVTSMNNYGWWDTYPYGSSANTLTKYNFNPEYGLVDMRSVVGESDDAARAALGGSWRLPTLADLEELFTGCDLAYSETGITLTAKSGQGSIFLPLTGVKISGDLKNSNIGYYWMNALSPDPSRAWHLTFTGEGIDLAANQRCYAMPIRPVQGAYIHVSGVSIKEASYEVFPDESVWVDAIISPKDAFEPGLTWTASDNTVVSLVPDLFSRKCKVTGLKPGTVTLTAKSVDGGFSASCEVTVKSNAIDLGLSVKWSRLNLGATAPDEYGGYFAWGETTAKSNFGWNNYKWTGGSGYTKYNDTDGKTVLDLEDDAARVQLGGTWRMPTATEVQQLVATANNANYQHKWYDAGEKYSTAGLEITYLVNGNSIFLPASGTISGSEYMVDPGKTGNYWSSSVFGMTCDYGIVASFDMGDKDFARNESTRYLGVSIRPVTE
ncbi:MAG: Ig-like domain-containing protein [Bacteroidales bacterium]|nr:Ig-like domain-containing protein [Bacteroidales bacterium]